jgi:multidrug efflux pump
VPDALSAIENKRADTAGQKADQANHDINELKGVVANLDDYKQVVQNTVNFKFNSDQLNTDAKTALDQMATGRSGRQRHEGLALEIARLNGKPTAGLSVLLSPTGNALATASAVEAKMKELSKFFPANIGYEIPYNITPVVKASIHKVLMTLVEAVVLVFIVMFLFLQNIRYTIIPTIVVPVALLGTCATLLAAGYSINMLTMFGMVLAVGILVDDAIVVVENVERIMAEEGLPPKEATRKAMSQITSAIIGITLVLMAVFVPMAFFPGSVGIIYRQFSVTMVSAIAFSALLALSLTPALCATLLKPVTAGHGHARTGVFGWFNRVLDSSRGGYTRTVKGSLKRTGRLMLIYAALLIGLGWGFVRLPGGFLPVDDQGFITTDVQTPSDSSYARTEAAVEQVEKYLRERAGVEDVTFLTGFSFLGQGVNTAQAFITLKDWSERGRKDSAAAIVADINRDLSSIRDAKISALQPPPIDNLGNSSGFSFRLQDRGQKGYPALVAAADRLIADANASRVLQKVYVEGLPPAPQVNLMIDREKAGAFGVTFEDINQTISTNLGSNYINDFPNRGRMQRVIVQADRASRMNADDILNYNVKNSRGQLVPFSAFATVQWSKGPTQIAGFNYYPAVRISGEAKPGFTSGDAIAEMEREALETEGRLDLRGFLGIDPSVPAGYETIRYRVRVRGDATRAQFEENFALKLRHQLAEFDVQPGIFFQILRPRHLGRFRGRFLSHAASAKNDERRDNRRIADEIIPGTGRTRMCH